MNCPVCAGEVVEGKCTICPGIIYYKHLLDIMCDEVSGEQLAHIFNYVLDLGFNVEYRDSKNGTYQVVYPGEKR